MNDDKTKPEENVENVENSTPETQENTVESQLLQDLQRLRADFENYRKRVDTEKSTSRHDGYLKAVKQILPILDTLEMATKQVPEELKNDSWVKGILSAKRQVEKTAKNLNLEKIDASEGVEFDHNLHQAVQVDEDAEGEMEVVKTELQAGYKLEGAVIRPSMVSVTRK